MRRALLGCILLAVLCAGCDSSRSEEGSVVAVTVTPTVIPTATASAPTATSARIAIATEFAPAATATAMATLRTASLDRLNDAERTWQTSRVTNYQIRSSIEGEASPGATMEIKVDKGQASRVGCSPHLPTGSIICSYLRTENFTVSGLFQSVRGAIYDPNVRLSVDYDAIYGFPRSIVIESRRSSGWSGTGVEDFVVLP